MSDTASKMLPLLRMGFTVLLLALLPLAWWWLRQRGADTRSRLTALTALTLFLTFDLIVFGAYTRLSDSGLGCPDWPGCYAQASPLAAHADIAQAQAAMPSGPVTHAKAWIEMVHRYLAMTVGLLIVLLTAAGWRAQRSLPHSPWWATATLAWVIVQGVFGRYTVTLKLYPAIVSAHLLGGMVLLALLAWQYASLRARPVVTGVSGRAIWAVLALVAAQIALGGWVSSNYAVLACQGFPTCNGQWWPAMDPGHGFTLLRELGRTDGGGFLPAQALVAIHLAHRVAAMVVVAALAWLVWRLASGRAAESRHGAAILAVLMLLQVASGVSNVVLGWPLVAALGHSAGAAALVGVLTMLAWRPSPARQRLTVSTQAHTSDPSRIAPWRPASLP